jgi:hypothetical protein
LALPFLIPATAIAHCNLLLFQKTAPCGLQEGTNETCRHGVLEVLAAEKIIANTYHYCVKGPDENARLTIEIRAFFCYELL